MHQRGAQQSFADQAGATGASGACILLVEDHFLAERNSATTVFGRPTNAGPTGGGEVAFPIHPLMDEAVFVAGAATVDERRELAVQIDGHPVPDLGPEVEIRRGIAELHGRHIT